MIRRAQRASAKWLCVATGAVSALLCALNGAPVLAAVQGLAALIVATTRFGRLLAPDAVESLLSRLRDARSDDDAEPAAPRAQATIFGGWISLQGDRGRAWQWRDAETAFRDELSPRRWRDVTTGLRHQSSPTAVPGPERKS